MGRRLLVNLAALTAAQRAALSAAAESQGFEAIFRDDAPSARSAAGEAEIIFSIDAGLMECAPALKWFCTPAILQPCFLTISSAVCNCAKLKLDTPILPILPSFCIWQRKGRVSSMYLGW